MSRFVMAATVTVTVMWFLVMTVVARGYNEVVEEYTYLIDDVPCHTWGYGNCSRHEGCEACRWKLGWPHVRFCASNATALKLPKCTSGGWGCE